jgi:hypothetical protein
VEEGVGSPGAVEVGDSPGDRALGNLVDTAVAVTGKVGGVVGEEGTLDMHDTAAGTVGTVGQEDTVDRGSHGHPCTVRGTVGELPQDIAGIAEDIEGLVSCSSPEAEEELAEAYLRRLLGQGCTAGWCNHPQHLVAAVAAAVVQEPPECSSTEPFHELTSFSLRPS